MRHYWKENRGSVLVFAAISMVALIGMSALAVDLGRLYAAKSRAQDICDASAIAGAYQLDGTNDPTVLTDATDTANKTTSANDDSRPGWPIYDARSGGTKGTVLVDFPYGSEVKRDNGDTVMVEDGPITRELREGEAIRVTGWIQVDYGLANIFGGATGSRAAARAIAIRVYATGVTSAFTVPIALSDGNFDVPTPGDNLNYGEAETLKYDDWKEYDGLLGPGNFGLLDIAELSSDKGIRDLFAFRTGPVSLSVGDYRDSYTGDKVGLVRQGINDRLTYTGPYNPDVPDNTYYDTEFRDGQFQNWVDAGMPLDSRIMICPIIRDTNINGSKSLEIVGFAAFYVDSWDSGSKTISARFVQAIIGNSGDPWVIPDLNPGDPVPPGGNLLEVKLIK